MKFCEKCGKGLPDNAAFCDGCGSMMGGNPNAAPQNNYAAPQQNSYGAPQQNPYNVPGSNGYPNGYNAAPQNGYNGGYQNNYNGYNNPYPGQNTNPQSSPASMILGIVGIVFAWLFALVGHITSIIGIVLGIKEYKATGKMTGLVLSIIGEVCSVLSSIIGAATMLALM